MIVNKIYDVHILIGGIDICDYGNANNINCTITEDVFSGVPVCALAFLSSSAFLSQVPIVDGTPVEIQIKSKVFEIDEKYNFRVAKMQATPDANLIFFEISCYLDFYELYRGALKYALCGNSSDVFQSVADRNNLQSLIHATDDRQIWVASEQNLANWLSTVAGRGWASDVSGMCWFMNRKKQLFYVDIDRLIYGTKTPRVTLQYGRTQFGDVENNIVKYKSFNMVTNTGEENLFNNGYGGDDSHFDLLKYSVEDVKAAKVRAASEIVNINKELSQGLGETYSMIDTGNFHPHYYLAWEQNRRVLSTYSSYINLICEYFRPLNLSQVVTMSAMASNKANSNINSLTLKYIISSLSIVINSSNIGMNIQLCSQGYNGKSTESY